MKLIADSGSTKTDWILLTDSGEKLSFRTEGINPYFHTSDSVAELLQTFSFAPYTHADIDEVDFYSAGSSTPQNRKLMEVGFAKVFTKADVNIIHDLLGAARALFGEETGIAAILGTGSNSCFYKDQKIVLTLGGHGYILGDEGSGMHIGRKVVRDFMNDLMPDDVRKLFVSEYGLSKDDIFFAVYKQQYPNRFLASFSKFVKAHIEHPYLLEMADDAFMKFFERYIVHYPDYQSYPLRILGSVGYYFEEQIRNRAEQYGVHIDKILKAPIDGLVEYHQNHQ
jgi:N-acetylglucosamine kinase-like BadF-type ATPase